MTAMCSNRGAPKIHGRLTSYSTPKREGWEQLEHRDISHIPTRPDSRCINEASSTEANKKFYIVPVLGSTAKMVVRAIFKMEVMRPIRCIRKEANPVIWTANPDTAGSFGESEDRTLPKEPIISSERRSVQTSLKFEIYRLPVFR